MHFRKRWQLPFDCTLTQINSQLPKILVTHFNIIIPSNIRNHRVWSHTFRDWNFLYPSYFPGVLHDRSFSYCLYICHRPWRAIWPTLRVIPYFIVLIFVQRHKLYKLYKLYRLYKFSVSNFLQSLSLALVRDQSAIFSNALHLSSFQLLTNQQTDVST